MTHNESSPMPARGQATRERKVGPNLVRAWFDTVINPLLRGLDSERRVLRRENWTWRWESRELLSLHPLDSFLAFEAWDNRDQLFACFPPARRKCLADMQEHDRRVAALTSACRDFHKALVTSRELADVYHRAKSNGDIPLQPGLDFDHLFGAYPAEKHLDVLAEEIVNGTRSVPAYYATAPLWNRYGDDFLRIRESPGLRKKWEVVRRTGAQLAESVDGLSKALRDVRQELSMEYDVPLFEASHPA